MTAKTPITANKTDALVAELKTALREKTAARKVEWKPAGNEDAFYWTSNGHSASIRRLRNGYGGPVSGFRLRFLRQRLELKAVTADNPKTPEYEALQDIFNLASESVNKAEDGLAEMLQEINSA